MENNTNPKQQLFTELFRPKTLDQAVIVPRIRQELEKGLIDRFNTSFWNSGCRKNYINTNSCSRM